MKKYKITPIADNNKDLEKVLSKTTRIIQYGDIVIKTI